jgi:hypothetical protein
LRGCDDPCEECLCSQLEKKCRKHCAGCHQCRGSAQGECSECQGEALDASDISAKDGPQKVVSRKLDGWFRAWHR